MIQPRLCRRMYSRKQWLSRERTSLKSTKKKRCADLFLWCSNDDIIWTGKGWERGGGDPCGSAMLRLRRWSKQNKASWVLWLSSQASVTVLTLSSAAPGGRDASDVELNLSNVSFIVSVNAAFCLTITTQQQSFMTPLLLHNPDTRLFTTSPPPGTALRRRKALVYPRKLQLFYLRRSPPLTGCR